MRRRRSRSGWLTPSVFGFGLASFLSDAGHEAATAVLPAFLATLGAAPAALGIIEGVSDGLASFAKLAGGWLADHPRRRKPIAVGGYVVTGVATAFFGFATHWVHVLAARSVGWLGRGVREPARDAMMADAVPEGSLGRAFGFQRAMDTAGAVIGPLVVAALATAVSLRSIFWWTAVPGLLSAVAFATLVRPSRASPDAVRATFGQSLSTLPGRFRAFVAAVFVFGLGDFARTLLILRATQLLTPSLGAARATSAALVLYVLHNVVYALASYPVGRLADRGSPRGLLTVGYLCGAATASLAALGVPSFWFLGALFGIAGLTLAFEDTLERTVTAGEAPARVRGTAYGVLAATNGVADLLSSSLVGLIWTAVGPRPAFGAAGALCLAGAHMLGIGSLRRAAAR
jgi:MFS family permease